MFVHQAVSESAVSDVSDQVALGQNFPIRVSEITQQLTTVHYEHWGTFGIKLQLNVVLGSPHCQNKRTGFT